jgi:hypothetical protein
MTEVDVKQQELDLAEQQILTDIFGGYTPDKFILRAGIFKYDLSGKVQKVLNDFERVVKPLMNDEGQINLADLRKYFATDFINLPEGLYRPIELYRKIQPLVAGLKDYTLGVRV